MATKKQPPRKSAEKIKRLPTSHYKHATDLAELLGNPDTPEDVRDRLEDALLELSSAAKVTVFHPQLVRAALLLMGDATRNAYFAGDKDRMEQMARLNGELRGLVKAAKEGKPLPPSRDERPHRNTPNEPHNASGGPAGLAVKIVIAELKRRLESLYSPEDKAVRFRTEREIYDLEHGAVLDMDEWPEVICAGGEQ